MDAKYDVTLKVLQHKYPDAIGMKKVHANEKRAIFINTQKVVKLFMKQSEYQRALIANNAIKKFGSVPPIMKHGTIGKLHYIIYKTIIEPASKKIMHKEKAKPFIAACAKELALFHTSAGTSKQSLFNVYQRKLATYKFAAGKASSSQIVALLENKIHVFQEELKKEKSHLIHGDFDDGNVLWADRVYLIDLEKVEFFDYHYDLSTFYLNSNIPMKEYNSFLEHYQKAGGKEIVLPRLQMAMMAAFLSKGPRKRKIDQPRFEHFLATVPLKNWRTTLC